MAELIWEGKHLPHKQNIANSSISNPQSFHTYESLHNEQTNADLYPERWHNRLIHGDKSKVLAALLPEFTGKVDIAPLEDYGGPCRRSLAVRPIGRPEVGQPLLRPGARGISAPRGATGAHGRLRGASD